MFSGKSSKLNKTIRRNLIAKKKCLLFKYTQDTRYSTGNTIVDHDGMQSPKEIPVRQVSRFDEEILKDVISNKYEFIGIDEGQFYEGIEDFCEQLQLHGIEVVVSALNGDFKRKPWPRISNLIANAYKILKLNAICCECGNKAPFTKRIINSNELELIGGSDEYKPVCLIHHTIPKVEL